MSWREFCKTMNIDAEEITAQEFIDFFNEDKKKEQFIKELQEVINEST